MLTKRMMGPSLQPSLVLPSFSTSSYSSILFPFPLAPSAFPDHLSIPFFSFPLDFKLLTLSFRDPQEILDSTSSKCHRFARLNSHPPVHAFSDPLDALMARI